jgi:hypothetical protein
MVFREIYNAAIQEMEQQGEHIRLELSQLYLSLETGGIDEATFDERERDLLDRLDELEARQAESEQEDTSAGEEQEQVDSENENEDEDEDERDDGPNVYLLDSEQETRTEA